MSPYQTDSKNLLFPETDIDARIAGLSPEKRTLLLKRLSRGSGDPGGQQALRARSGERSLELSFASAPIAPAPRGGELPLSFAQQRLWFLDRLLPAQDTYNIPTAWRLRGRLDAPALQRSLDELVARHETLRTRFAVREGEPVQVIDPPHSVALPIADLSAMPQVERETRARQIADTEARQPFDLEAGPLLRAQLLRLAPEEHLLLLNVHHIISDGWSAGIFERELSSAYNAFVSGREPRLPELPVQYADYALWQREWLQGEVLEEQLGYWKAQLADLPTLTLPTDRPRPPAMSYRGARAAFDLPEPLSRSLKALGRREGATLFMTLLAAFQVLLYRYSGEEDLAVGAPIAGRRRSELEPLIGFFANTLVLRVDLSGNPPFRELLARVRESALGAYTHQDLPFEKLVEELAPARDMSRNPLFQVLFALQNAPGATLALEGVEVSRLPLEGHTAKFDLSLSVRESAAGLHAGWEFSTDLFDAQTIERMARHFERLLEGIVADPEQRIGQLPLLTEAERHQLLVEWNDTAADYPKDRCIHELFEAQVACNPEAVAVVFEDQQLTYAELNARANQLAHHLIEIGVGPEVLVGLCMERSLELLIALLGILKAGGAYVPLDPGYPQARLALMLKDTAAPVLLTQQALLGQLPQYDGRIVCLDRDWPHISTHSAANPPSSAVTPKSLAYVIYTSGSTGEPKGVAVRQHGVIRLVRHSNYIELSASQTIAQVSNIAFDAATFEIWGALLNGGRLVIIAKDVALAPESFAAALTCHQITCMFLTTALFHHMSRAMPAALRGIRCVLFGGEACDPDRVRGVLEAGAPEQLIHVYGPTETTTFATFHPVRHVHGSDQTIPIGRPISETQVYILDRHAEPVPIGVTGEIHIGGPGVAAGYIKRPEETDAQFIAHPFRPNSGERVYRTGDLARYRPDGNIEFLGRIDHQVKIRGFRVELGEIEAVLAGQASVRQAVVLAREDIAGDKQLVAYVVPADASFPGTQPLRTLLREHLPDYMLPSAYVVLERLPLTPNGKVDRQALPAPQYDRSALGIAFVAPRDSLEELVSGVWREVLDLEQVGVHDNFFELGGHSLLAAQVVARLAKLLKIELPLRGFFESPTVSALAAEVQKRLGAGEAREATSIASAPRTGDLPLSFAQQRLWFLDRLLPAQDTYNIPTAWRLQGRLDAPALQLSLEELVLRHETLRTRFAVSEGEPVQVIDPPHSVALPVTDFSTLPQVERETRARQIADTEARQPFDLEAGPLLRAQLLRLAPEEHLLLLNVHHIVSDGWSMGILERELSSAYNAFVLGRESRLPELPVQYADYALWQREWLQGEVLEGQLAYWKNQLADISTLELPADRVRPPLASHLGSHLAFDLPAPLSAALKALGRREGATLFMTLLAAFQVLLYRYSGQDDIAVGTPIAGRGRSELEGLIGFFANTLVLRSDLAGDPGFRELLARVRESALGAYTHQDLPFEKLVEELAPERDLSRKPLFQVMFALQNAPGSGLALEGVQVSRVPIEGRSAKFDLSLSVRETPAGLHTGWEFNTDLFDAQTIERMSRHFERLLEGIVADQERCIGELPLLTEAERHQLLVEWNDTAADYPRDRCIHQLFEEQAARTPAAVAVVFEDQQLTYAELNARANQLAHHLIALGVGPEVLVGLCLERSLELIVGLLGILKAGGAYVPLDTSYPKERLAFMLKDTQAPVLLTQQALLAQLPPYEGRILCLDRDEIISAQPDTDPPCRATAENLAYLIYTSGSTGRPKGVAVPHRGVLRLLLGIDYVRLDERQTFLMLSPISFDASTFELWGALLRGARCAIFHEQVPTIETLGEVLQRYQVSTLWLTASLFNVVIDEAPQILSGVRQLLTGGEALSPTHVRAALQRLPDVQLINGYGPTESTTFTCCYRIPNPLDETRLSIPIGRPICNTRVYVLDRYLSPVPLGVAGELCIGGDGLARGYLNRPELTAEKFLPDPFSTVPGARMYRTGDLARYLPDGNIEYLGRIDDQVKIRGFRIEPGEIETVLAEHVAVRQAVVLAREDAPGDKRLVAYIVPADASLTDIEPLRALLRERLPDYMRPAAYVLLERLPLSPSGKVDRQALPQPGRGSYFARAEYIAARNAIEVQLLRIWQDILGVSQIGMRDEFFALGGHSLAAVRVIDNIARIFGRRLPLDTFWYEEGTIEHLAQLLASKSPSPLWSAAVPFKPSGARRALFCPPVVGGHLYFYDILARHLSSEQPVYGLPARGIDGTVAADTRVEAMAAHCIDTMRQVQSVGPYRLLGYCSGGRIAFEMAQQLHARGEQVEFLALLDSDAPGFNLTELVFTMWSLIRLRNLRSVQQRLYRFVLQNLGLSRLREFRTVLEAHYWAHLSYKGRSYPGEACVFIPTKNLRWRAADLGWGRLVQGKLNIHPILGWHADMIQEPGVRTLAALLQRRLDGLETTSD